MNCEQRSNRRARERLARIEEMVEELQVVAQSGKQPTIMQREKWLQVIADVESDAEAVLRIAKRHLV
jgi:hypothetical protein